jgi:SAM-dependent methyltransferase
MNRFHEANRQAWNAWARAGYGQVDRSRDWRACFHTPDVVFGHLERRWLGDVAGRRVCVLGSGDNTAVFALAGLGAHVTSVDISEEQLRIAAERAAALAATIAFVRADVTDLSALATGAFDVVYTGGHVAVWVSDLFAYYREAVRILHDGGLFIVNEYHPFRRIWKQEPGPLVREFGYFDRGPHPYNADETAPGGQPGTRPSYEYHWTVSDFLAAVRKTEAELLEVEETGDDAEAWERVSLAGLPRALLIVARKNSDAAPQGAG